MNMDNPFVLPISEYRRELNIMQNYVEDSALYLNKMTGRPLEECLNHVKNSIRPGGQYAFRDPEIMYLQREENGDRVKKFGTLLAYLNESIRHEELIAPTMTTYLPPKKKKSLLVDFIDANVKARGVAKKAMFKAKMENNKAVETIKKIEQTNKKLSNNSVSGAHVSASTPLYNKTAHSTLTSNCRSTSGYGNANNEKYLCGNRHYWSPDIVRNNIISIINHSDYALIEKAMVEFGIRHPTVDEVMDCITFSTHHYWHNPSEIQKLRDLVGNLSPIERSAFVYTGDLYHLRKYNDEVVRTFITKLSMRIAEVHADPKAIMDATPEEYHQLAAQICPTEMKGKTMHAVTGTPAHGIVASTVENIRDTIQAYRTLIRAFWVTPNLPASVAYFPDSIRHAAITSDTDSTIFTVQDWVNWHQGRIGFDDKSNAVAATMIFLAAQAIVHILAKMSANFGIEEKRLHQVAMKNEFKFDVFVPTQVAKHYFAYISCQEGNLFEEYDKEIKGVHLKSSNAPKAIMAEAKKMMEAIMTSVVEEKPISIKALLKQVGDIERGVVASIKKGSHEYFRMGQIKSPDSYSKSEEESPYSYYLLWQEVFAPKYGNVPPPPFSSVKISTNIDTATKAKTWLADMEDKELASRIERWMMKSKGKVSPITTFHLPEQILSSNGIPSEILAAIDVRKIILDTTKVFYLILECLGIYMLNDKATRLISDHY